MFNRRLIVLLIAFLFAFCALGVKLFKLQVSGAEYWRGVVREFVHQTHPLETYRGAIRDRNLKVLAADVPTDELAIDYRAMNYDEKWLDRTARAQLVASGEWDKLKDRAQRLRRRDEVKADLVDKIDAMPETIAKVCGIPREEILDRFSDIRARILALKQDMWSRRKFDRSAAKGSDTSSRPNEDDPNADKEYNRIQLKEEVTAHTIRTNLPPEIAHYFRQNAAEFPGLVIRDKANRRDYPYGEATAHITGTLRYVDADTVKASPFAFPDMVADLAAAEDGAATQPTGAGSGEGGGNLRGYLRGDRMGEKGVELLMESTLRGSRGARLIDLTETGDAADSDVRHVDPVPGRDVQLTIDADLQAELYGALLDRSRGLLQGKDGKDHFVALAVLSMDGQVMALVSYPSYDPNAIDTLRGTLMRDQWRMPLWNRAYQMSYSPGSTVKPLLAAAALTEHVITPDETINCIGHFFERSDIFRCDGIHGSMNLVPAIAKSCNVYFYTVGQRLGLERLSDWYGRYGFGRDTGMELGEAKGNIPKPHAADADTRRNESLLLGIGQGTVDVTPLQMANAYATLLRGGVVIPPHILADTRPQPVQAFTISDSVLQTVRRGMQQVVINGTGTAAFGPFVKQTGLTVAGKTGTAERIRAVFDDEGNPVEDPGKPLLNPDRTPKLKPDGTPMYRQATAMGTDAWFVGYAPADGPPQYVVAAVMEWGGHGGTYAAPMVREAFAQLLKRGYFQGRAVGLGSLKGATLAARDAGWGGEGAR
jgi:penicillin-binding protein 2